jgi:hypothetical protein
MEKIETITNLILKNRNTLKGQKCQLDLEGKKEMQGPKKESFHK